MSNPAEVALTPLTASQLEAVDSHVRDLNHQIDTLLDEERRIVAHTIARLAVAAHPTAALVTVHGIRDVGGPNAVTCEGDGETKTLSIEPVIATALASMLRRLPAGYTGGWYRHPLTATLVVKDALTFGDQYPFLSVQEQMVAHIEEKTGRDVRRIEIVSELWENGYFYCDTVEVDYTDGDSDSVYFENMPDFAGELRRQLGDPGPNTVVTINCTSSGTTIR